MWEFVANHVLNTQAINTSDDFRARTTDFEEKYLDISETRMYNKRDLYDCTIRDETAARGQMNRE